MYQNLGTGLSQKDLWVPELSVLPYEWVVSYAQISVCESTLKYVVTG